MRTQNIRVSVRISYSVKMYEDINGGGEALTIMADQSVGWWKTHADIDLKL